MFTGFMQMTPSDARKISDTKNGLKLGTVGVTRDGRIYRYTKAGGSTLAPGKITVAATVDTNVTNKTVARDTAVGARQVIIDAAGAITADAYADGTLNINDNAGEGITYAVRGNSVTSGAAELIVDLDERVEVALTIDVSEASLTKNPWGDTVISVADQADMAVGIPNVSITTAYFGWTQTGGMCAALADTGGWTAGKAITIGSATVGAVEDVDAAGEAQIGVGIVAGVATEYREIYLTID